jgi:RNA polymerase sigma factor (sigma-70 family)
VPTATVQSPAFAASRRRGGGSDEQLARAAGRGDVAAFEALYERYHVQLLSFSRHMLGRVHDAEDVVQHTFIAADRVFRSGKVPKAVRGWLYTVARNRCVSLLRARREEHELPDAGLPSTENLAADVEQRADLRELLADLRTLPDDQRAALLLSELGDLTHAEVAKVIGVRSGKVKALVFQARQNLMAAADARSIPCHAIREELAVATGAALRRKHLRNHLAQCEDCGEFAARVRAQRASLAAILPVVPTIALRDSVLAALGSGGAAAAGAGGAGAGIGMLAAKSTAAKVLTIAAIGGAAAGGGTVAVTAVDSSRPERRAERPAQPVPSAPTAAPAALPTATAAPASDPVGVVPRERDRAAARERRRSERQRGKNTRKADARGAAPTAPGQADKKQPGSQPSQARGRALGRAKQRAEGEPPPGQAKRVARGKPIPPGQAKKQTPPEPKAKAKTKTETAPAAQPAEPAASPPPAAVEGQAQRDVKPAKDQEASVDAAAGG